MGTISSLPLESASTRHCGVVVVVIGGDGGADKIFAVFFDGVLLSQKTHGLLLASVRVPYFWREADLEVICVGLLKHGM